MILALSCFSIVTAAGKFNFTWALGSSATFYGDEAFVTTFNGLKDRGYKNIVLSGELGMRVIFMDNVAFCLNGVISMDTLTLITSNHFFFDYGISGGVKIYPGLAGFNFGIEYITGRRSDVMDDVETVSTSWGNGFRLLLEYEFENLIKSFSPSLGVAWRRMPRGNDVADNILSFYVRAPF